MPNRLLGILVAAFAAVTMAACAYGSPPGFSPGKSWTFPLVDPLENGTLVTPVFINDKGPFLFAIDPDAMVTIVDKQVASEALGNDLGMHSHLGRRQWDQTDTTHPEIYVNTLNLRIGTLTVENQRALVADVGFYNTDDGRHIQGVLGRNIIADSLVLGFDRDLGIGYLATQEGFTPPANASVVSYDMMRNRYGAATSRRMVKATIAGPGGSRSFDMHLDFGRAPSELRKKFWDEKLGLTPLPIRSTQVDEVGTSITTTELVIAPTITVGHVTTPRVAMLPYSDKRWDEEDIAGTLGLDFWRGSNVWGNWDARKLYLVPRSNADQSAMRIGRWHSQQLQQCPDPGCVQIALDSTGGLIITRDPGAAGLPLEVFLHATPAVGGVALAPLVVNVPATVDAASAVLDAHYLGAQLTVTDVSPFPRACNNNVGCIVATSFGPL